MSAVGAIVRRDVRASFAGGGALLPPVFYLLVATLLPFAVGSDAALLAKVGGGMLWAAALLAALLPIDRLVAPDQAAGVLDQLSLRGVSEEEAMAAKIVAHWLAFAPPLLAATVPAAGLLGLPPATLGRVALGFAIGTPGLAALAVAVAALTAGLRAGSGLAGLILVPLALPLLIFGAGALAEGYAGALKLLGATSLLLMAGAPFVAGAAIRAGRG